MWETWVQSLHWEDPLEKEMAIHSSILAWRIPRTVESQRVGHNWKNFTLFFFFFFPLQKLREGIIHIHISLQGISGKYSTAETRTRKRPCCMWKKPQLNPINMPRKIDTRGKDRLMGSEYRVILKTTNNLRDLPAPVPLHEVKKEC